VASSPRPVVICSLGRTGSTLVSAMLQNIGACTGGEEFLEYLGLMQEKFLPAVGLSSLAEVEADLPSYLQRIQKHWGRPGKPFCIKIHWDQLERWQPHGLDLGKQFPDARYIWCTRSNFVAQSVSLFRAMQTGAWTAQHSESTVPEQQGFWRFMYTLSRQVQKHQSWQEYFSARGITPYRAQYEALDADYRQEALKLLDWLEVRVGPLQKRRLKPQLQKQRDTLNRDWEDRFYRDLVHWYTQWEQLPLEERRRIWAREPG
jgi:LPS sulfotransferase NodH